MHGRKTTEEGHGCREGHAEGQRRMLRRDGGQQTEDVSVKK